MSAVLSPRTSNTSSGQKATPRRVLFLLDHEMGHVTVHVRGLMFKDRFAAAGWEVEYLNVRKVPFEQIVARAREFPAVYLLKVCFLRLVRELKEGAPQTKIIFDLTDALWQPVHRACGWQHLEKILGLVDVIFSENEFICAYGRKFCSDVVSIPTSTQVEKFDAARGSVPPRSDQEVRLGWMGSNGTVAALHAIAEQLRGLFIKYPQVHLRILGCSDEGMLPRLPAGRYSVVPTYDETAMIGECLKFDVGLFPPPGDLEDYAIRGALKAMIYMTAGVPCVCLNAGDCARVLVDGQTGMLVDSPEEWTTKLEMLITDEGRRRRMGAAALAAIRQGHTMEAVFAALEGALLRVLEQAPPALK